MRKRKKNADEESKKTLLTVQKEMAKPRVAGTEKENESKAKTKMIECLTGRDLLIIAAAPGSVKNYGAMSSRSSSILLSL